MMSQADVIRKFKPFPYKKYSGVSSREKLVVFVIKHLESHNIQATFNNICVASFKLFPEKFYFSEEFKEFPHIEMLNRTILHLRPVERNYATGNVRSVYSLTEIGEEIARQVKHDIDSGSLNSGKKKLMDEHKKSSIIDYNDVLRSNLYSNWLKSEDRKIDDMKVWSFFKVTPYTQVDKVKLFIDQTSAYAKVKGDDRIIEFLDLLRKSVA